MKQTKIYEGTNNPLNNIKWICDDVRNIDFTNVSIVILYLIPSAINQLNNSSYTNLQTFLSLFLYQSWAYI